MKKKIIFLNLILALFMSGCTNTNVNNVMSSISNTLESGINNVSNFISKLAANKPSSVSPAVPKSKYFEMESYKLEIKYADSTGIEVFSSGFLYNKAGTTLTLIIDFPIYDLEGKVVDKGKIRRNFYPNGASYIMGNYTQYRLKKDLRIIQEDVRTSVYMNDKLIASAGKDSSSAPKSIASKQKQSQKQETVKQEKESKSTSETVINNSASPKPRQARQSVKK